MKSVLYLMLLMLIAFTAIGQEPKKKKKKKPPLPFKWVNPMPTSVNIPGLTHRTFVSPSLKHDIGYCIYLPPQYRHKDKGSKRYPVVYYLHGGRPGSEIKSIKLANYFHKHISSGDVKPMIYVFVNGGKVSHYNMPEMNSLGEDIFIKELIPHIDKTYRTIAKRESRGVEGFSQGGRGTTRIMFEYPQYFCSAAPGGSGYETEKRISENDGKESEKLQFQPGHNCYDRARKYAKNQNPALRIMIHVGTKGFNYENNLAYMKFLDELKIPYEKTIAEGAPHSATKIYDIVGSKLMKFHEKNFGL